MKHYSITHQMSIASIPPQLLGELRPHDIRILNLLLWFFKKDLKIRWQAKPRCWPGLKYISDMCRCSKWTASRSVNKLAMLGIITKFQLRDRNGVYHTNLYRIGGLMKKWCKLEEVVKELFTGNRLRRAATNRSNLLRRKEFNPYGAEVSNFGFENST